MKKFYSLLQLLMLIIIGVSAIFYFNFTAEDAYITYRYSENWVNTGSLVYNVGEPINAMTSPLHAVLSTALFLVTGNTVLSNKILALALLFISASLVWHRYKAQLHLQGLAIVLLVPPCVLLWTFGGLETPFLLFLTTVSVILALRPVPFTLGSLCGIFFLTGLAFLTRYDSVLFFLPLSLYAASKTRSIKNILIAASIAAILPLAWILISFYYYGDLLPTSFYVKTPSGNLWGLIFNARYIASYLLYVGIIPVIILVLILLIPGHHTIKVLYRHFKNVWWLYAALALEALYGLTMATHHMMFSFRFFVPYIPSTVLLLLDLVRYAAEDREIDLVAGGPAYLFMGFLLCLLSFQLYQTVFTYTHSVNGISSIGEYQALSIRDYTKYMQTLKQEGQDIEQHWKVTHPNSDRRPRVITFAAGMLPYTYRDSYIYEQLVSYRHCHQRYQQGLYADYLHILAPRQGQIDEQLPRSEGGYELVSSYEIFFDGSMQNFLVYYNPQPAAHNLTAGINDFCKLDVQAAH